MCGRARQLDVRHPFAPHFGLGDFDATLFADHTTMLQALVFTAQAFVIFDWAKNLRTEEPVSSPA